MWSILSSDSYSSCVKRVSYKLALNKSTANDWTTRAFATCLYRDWAPCCCSWWPSTTPEGVQGGERHSVLQGIWWHRSLDNWMFLRTDFYLGRGVSLHSCSSKAQLLLLTLDEGYLLTVALPDLQRGIAPLGPPAPKRGEVQWWLSPNFQDWFLKD